MYYGKWSCPESTIAGYQFTNHYDCVDAGYSIAQSTFRNLKEWKNTKEYYRKNKIS
jgi:hypothetical protein